MHLLIRRSERDDGWIQTSMTFSLYAELSLDAEEEYLFTKYNLHDRVVYNSAAFLEHLDAADKYRENAADDEADLFTIAENSFAALGHNIMGRISLQLTLQNLLDGIRVESQDLEEILHVKQLVHTSVQYLAEYLEIAVTFDTREELDEY